MRWNIRPPEVIIRRGIPIVLLLGGVVLTAILILTGPRPKQHAVTEREQVVEAIKLAPLQVVPQITGYGEVQPSRTWKAVAQISGKVAWKSPKLKSGEFFKSGELLLRIDDSESKLKIHRGEAEVKKYQAKIEELNHTRDNLQSQLEILKKILAFNEKELKRQQSLLKARAVAETTVDKQDITVLQQRETISELESSLRLLPAQLASQKAELASAEASLAQTRLELDYARITAPFDCRISSITVEERQYVASGQEMFTAYATDEVEIPVQFSLDQLELLLHGAAPKQTSEAAPTTRPPSPDHWKIGIKVNGGVNAFHWKGKFRRMASGIDTATRMISMVVAVADPYNRNRSHGTPRPPLDTGLFCAVRISGAPRDNVLVIPREALHDDKVYLADKNSRLEVRTVKISCTIGRYAAIETGLSAGEVLAVSDLVPAVTGMKLAPRLDHQFARKAAEELSGGNHHD